MKRNFSLGIGLLLFANIMIACQPVTSKLPLPQNPTQATLVNFRPITDSDRAGNPIWSPDGKILSYSEVTSLPPIFVPAFTTFMYPQTLPGVNVWVVSKEGKNRRQLAAGSASFFSKNGSDIYYFQHDARTNQNALEAVNLTTGQTRQLLAPQSIWGVHMLSNGNLVLSEWGTYAPLQIFDPVSGKETKLMEQHPSNFPEEARLSPDGALLAYTKFQDIFLSQPDGSNPKPLSENGCFSAQIWWSPDSQYLAYTSGNSQSDRLLLANRKGENIAVLFPNLGESGYISSLVWASDSRWLLVATEPYEQYSRPTALYLFDLTGNSKLILENFLSSPPAWSPDGQTLALPIWSGSDADQPMYNIWLADLTDDSTAASLSHSSALPTFVPTPTLSLPSATLTAETVLREYWDAIDAKDYYLAWSALLDATRENWKWPDFRNYANCIEQVSVESLQEVSRNQLQQVFSVRLNLKANSACNEMWQQPSQFYAVMSRASSTAPWLIVCFNSTPNCLPSGP
jgi:Tol biopolymer transport system component